MEFLAKCIHRLTLATKWGATLTLFAMMVVVTVSVLSRALIGKPIIGDYELVEVMMVTIIALGMAYVEYLNSHIKVGLLVDRFSERAQHWVDLIMYIIVFVFCAFIATVQLTAAIKIVNGYIMPKTMLLSIPHYPFKFILALGFYIWALEALLKTIYKVYAIRMRKTYTKDESNLFEGESSFGG